MSDPTAETPPVDPTDPTVTDAEPQPTDVAASTPPVPARRRRRGLIAVLVLVGILVALGIAAVIAENVARAQAQALIAEQVREALRLEPDVPVDVVIEGGPVLLQAAAGGLERVVVEVPELAIGELRGALTLIAEGSPLDTAQPTERVQAVFRVAEADIAALAGFFAGAVASEVRLDDREIRFETGFDIFGVPFTVGIGITPTVEEGQLAFTPSSVVLGDERLDAAQLQEQFGGIVDPLLTTQRLCVAQYLPQALVLTAVQVGDEQLVIVLEATEAALGGPEFSSLGTCS